LFGALLSYGDSVLVKISIATIAVKRGRRSPWERRGEKEGASL
jgi:hypothetical protein